MHIIRVQTCEKALHLILKCTWADTFSRCFDMLIEWILVFQHAYSIGYVFSTAGNPFFLTVKNKNPFLNLLTGVGLERDWEYVPELTRGVKGVRSIG